MASEKLQQYQNQKIMTASPAMLVFMLFDKAISSLKEAIHAIENGDIETRWKANNRAMEIMEQLRVTLNFESGGEIAQNLDSIYGLVLRLLPEVDKKNDPGPAIECIQLLEPLRASWKEIADQGDKSAAQAAQAAQAQAPIPARKAPSPDKAPEGKGTKGITLSA